MRWMFYSSYWTFLMPSRTFVLNANLSFWKKASNFKYILLTALHRVRMGALKGQKFLPEFLFGFPLFARSFVWPDESENTNHSRIIKADLHFVSYQTWYQDVSLISKKSCTSEQAALTKKQGLIKYSLHSL